MAATIDSWWERSEGSCPSSNTNDTLRLMGLSTLLSKQSLFFISLMNFVLVLQLFIGLSLTHTGSSRQIGWWKCLKDVSLPPTNPLERAGLSVCVIKPDRVYRTICILYVCKEWTQMEAVLISAMYSISM